MRPKHKPNRNPRSIVPGGIKLSKERESGAVPFVADAVSQINHVAADSLGRVFGLSDDEAIRRIIIKVIRDERDRAGDLVKAYLMHDSQRACSWHEAHDCMSKIREMPPEEES